MTVITEPGYKPYEPASPVDYLDMICLWWSCFYPREDLPRRESCPNFWLSIVSLS